MADVDHPHVDVVQLHRADNLAFSNGDPVVAKLDGGRLRSALVGTDSIRMSSNKIDKYKLGFLTNVGCFSYHGSPSFGDHAVTFAQAYWSAAKMARPRNSGFVAAYALCRGYVHAGAKFKSLADETRQYLRNLDDYANLYVCKGQPLRIEEVLTLDPLRRRKGEKTIAEQSERLRVFDSAEPSLTTRALLGQGFTVSKTGPLTSTGVSVKTCGFLAAWLAPVIGR